MQHVIYGVEVYPGAKSRSKLASALRVSVGRVEPSLTLLAVLIVRGKTRSKANKRLRVPIAGQSTTNLRDELRTFRQDLGRLVVLRYEDFESGGKPG